MDIKYDSEADALYIKISEGAVAKTKKNGDYLVDYDKNNGILGIEVLFCSRNIFAKTSSIKANVLE